MTRFIAILAAMLVLSSCGWHLRGALDLPADLNSIYVTGASQSLRSAIDKQLSANNIALAANASDAQYILAISNEDTKQRTAALGSDALAAEYEYTSSANFELRRTDGTVLGAADNVQVVRSVNFDATQVLGAANESQLVKDEMTRELASQLIRRMSFLAKQNAQQDDSQHNSQTSTAN
ncbi:LPS assembly lipoprotein LptE [Simiduia curdlanivorans]|uniref:LPS-assembly lipoprotein LptE n=1 Tax=Simiduia curdlanivorans TaxID=1492769 RepID=A0ABV8V6K9_9GAMM|nr:LPS assembly lipoprotein LptE [Simiduia curdlanivorans]MDN3638863.1 LPS assembly lipoprotein LptE [Simiduia curdlanivorans]